MRMDRFGSDSAVITDRVGRIGVYLYDCGGRDSVEAFLAYCRMMEYFPPGRDGYGWAKLVQVISNCFTCGLESLVLIDTVDRLGGDEGNGTYIIEDWKIVDRRYFDGEEDAV